MIDGIKRWSGFLSQLHWWLAALWNPALVKTSGYVCFVHWQGSSRAKIHWKGRCVCVWPCGTDPVWCRQVKPPWILENVLPETLLLFLQVLISLSLLDLSVRDHFFFRIWLVTYKIQCYTLVLEYNNPPSRSSTQILARDVDAVLYKILVVFGCKWRFLRFGSCTYSTSLPDHNSHVPNLGQLLKRNYCTLVG